jgi:hypothetical protein
VITGSGFGTGPNVVLFDNFEGGTNDMPIMTGAGSATVGKWEALSNFPYYTNATSVSGGLSFRADQSTHWLVYSEVLLPPATTDIFPTGASMAVRH